MSGTIQDDSSDDQRVTAVPLRSMIALRKHFDG